MIFLQNRLVAFLSLAAVALGTAASELGAGERDPDSSHERMIRELNRVARESSRDNPFLGVGPLLRARETVEQLPAGTDPLKRAHFIGVLGWEYLRYGDVEKAIETLETATSILDESGFTGVTEVHRSLILAHFRMAETENCCARNTPESCIFPLEGQGIHRQRKGGERTLELIREVLPRIQPDTWFDLELRWLANLAQMTLGHPLGELPKDWSLPEESILPDNSAPFPRFRNVSATSGVNTYGLAGGAVAEDFDNDGDFDLVVSEWDPEKGMRYFENRGDLGFEDRTAGSELDRLLGGLNIKQADYDNDGDLDLFVFRGGWMRRFGRHPNSLLRNDGPIGGGGVRFTDVTFEVGLGQVHYPTQTGDWADFDLDGDLDLFVGNESGPGFEFPCQLFRNDGVGTERYFVDVARGAGVETFRYVKGVSWGDYDGDRFPDLYVSCLGNPNALYRNLGDGRFEDVTESTGTAEPVRSFPTWFWDFDNDGKLDLFVSDYRGTADQVFRHARGMPRKSPSLSRLYRNIGGGQFHRAEKETGLDMPMLPMGSNFGDLTNDGFPDLYLGTGDPDFSTIVPNLLISNENGRFHDRTVASRLGHLQKGHAVSFADFDRDGDLDIFEQMGGAYRVDPFYDALFENPGTNAPWISIALRGKTSNRFGVGCRVRVVGTAPDGKQLSFYQWMNSGGSFGANPLELHFGLGGAIGVEQIEVFWPATNRVQVVDQVEMNRRIVIEEE